MRRIIGEILEGNVFENCELFADSFSRAFHNRKNRKKKREREEEDTRTPKKNIFARYLSGTRDENRS